MKRALYMLLWLLAALLVTLACRAQVIVGNYPVRFQGMAPSGSCNNNTSPLTVNAATGYVYSCQSGTWAVVGPGGGGGGGVASINGTTGAFTFTGAGVSCSATTCTFTGGGGGGTPGGISGAIQYNNSGAFGGSVMSQLAAGDINVAPPATGYSNILLLRSPVTTTAGNFFSAVDSAGTPKAYINWNGTAMFSAGMNTNNLSLQNPIGTALWLVYTTGGYYYVRDTVNALMKLSIAPGATGLNSFIGPLQTDTSISTPALTVTGLGTSTSPVCPNGTSGALTTTGCTAVGGPYLTTASPAFTGTLSGPNATLTGLAGTGARCLQTDATGNISAIASACGTGGGTPAGTQGQLQYYNAGAFGASNWAVDTAGGGFGLLSPASASTLTAYWIGSPNPNNRIIFGQSASTVLGVATGPTDLAISTGYRIFFRTNGGYSAGSWGADGLAIWSARNSAAAAVMALNGSSLDVTTNIAANATTNANSAQMNFTGNFWTTASTNDYWSIQNVLGTGTLTPTSTLTINHAGSPGAATVSINATMRLSVVTVATLPTCNAAAQGTYSTVSDATAPTYLGTLTGGGATVVPVFCNGTAWVAH